MRWLASRLADPEVDRRLAEIHRHELAVNVGHMQQRDVANRVEFEQVGFGQALPRNRTCECAVAGRERGGRGTDLKNFPTIKSGQIRSMPDARHAQLLTFVL